MAFKTIHVIINPASGQDEPILSYLNQAFSGTSTDWEVSITKRAGDATEMARQQAGKVDVVAVYGGDGSVAEAARGMQGSSTPMAILPGGTANVVAKELGIPVNTQAAIALLTEDTAEVTEMDMGLANDIPFMIRVNSGIMANMVVEADRELKNQVGQLAYGITALRTMIQAEKIAYRMRIDGREVSREGVALSVTNCGSIGIGDYTFLPDIRVNDGLLDVLLLREANLGSILRLTGTTLLQTESNVLEHWACKEVEIHFAQRQKLIFDDDAHDTEHLHIRVLPRAIRVVVPTPPPS